LATILAVVRFLKETVFLLGNSVTLLLLGLMRIFTRTSSASIRPIWSSFLTAFETAPLAKTKIHPTSDPKGRMWDEFLGDDELTPNQFKPSD
jgi:hypothetical protein